jgi:PAS domain-containing protein
MGAADHSSVDDRDLNLRQVIDSAPALIHTARPDGYLDFFNRTWLDFVGQPLKSLLGWKWTSWIHPEDVESFVQKWRESIATESASREPHECGGLMANIAGCCTINSRSAPEMEEFSSGMDRVLISRTGRGRRNSSEALPRHIRALFKSEPYEKSDESVLDIIRESLRFVHEDPNKREVRIGWSIEGSLPP